MKYLLMLLCIINKIYANELSKDITYKEESMIPPALLFDMAKYYDKITTMNCFFLDYSSLSFIDLSDLNKKKIQNNTILFDICKHNNLSSKVTINGTQYQVNSNFTFSYLSLNNQTNLQLLANISNMNGNISILNISYNCLTEFNDTFTNISNTISILLGKNNCKHSFTFRYDIHNQCGIFSYLIIFCGVFCLLYGYSIGKFSYILYTIFALFEIALEIFDNIGYFSYFSSPNNISIIILIAVIIMGSIFGSICSWSFQFRKLILLWFTGKVIYIFLFYSIMLPLFKYYEHDLFVLREILLIFSILLGFLLFLFVKEDGKYTQVISAIIMVVVGSYFIAFVGLNFIGGNLPFDLAIVFAHKYKNVEKEFYKNVSKYSNYIWIFGLYILLFVIGIIVMDPIKDMIERNKYKRMFDSDDEDSKGMEIPQRDNQKISTLNLNKSDYDEYDE